MSAFFSKERQEMIIKVVTARPKGEMADYVQDLERVGFYGLQWYKTAYPRLMLLDASDALRSLKTEQNQRYMMSIEEIIEGVKRRFMVARHLADLNHRKQEVAITKKQTRSLVKKITKTVREVKGLYGVQLDLFELPPPDEDD
jgi:hypothetical protein